MKWTPGRDIIEVFRLGLREPIWRRTAVASFVLLLPLYAVMLPTSLTGGYIGWVSLRMLTPELGVIAFVLALLLALTFAFMALALRIGYKAGKSAAAGGVIVGFLTPLLCCSPLIPLAFAALATVFPAFVGLAPGRVQGFIAVYETWFLIAAIVLAALALYQNARRAVRGARCRTGITRRR